MRAAIKNLNLKKLGEAKPIATTNFGWNINNATRLGRLDKV